MFFEVKPLDREDNLHEQYDLQGTKEGYIRIESICRIDREYIQKSGTSSYSYRYVIYFYDGCHIRLSPSNSKRFYEQVIQKRSLA